MEFPPGESWKGKPQPKKMLPRIQGRKAAKKEAVHLGKAAAKPSTRRHTSSMARGASSSC